MKFGKILCYVFLLPTILFLTKLCCTTYDFAWHPSGDYLVRPASNNYPAIYSFDKNTNSLTYTNSQNSGGYIYAFSWTNDGKYIAVGTLSSSSNELQVFGISDSGKLTGASLAGFNYAADVYRVNWNPIITSGSSKYCLAVGSGIPGVTGCDELTIFQYDGSTSLSVTDSRNLFTNGGRNNVMFHPSGNYLAVLLGYYASNTYDLQVFKFDSSTRKIINASPYTGKKIHKGTNYGGLCWSPDGRYLAVSGYFSDTLSEADLYVYRFYQDNGLPFTSRLELVDSRNIGSPTYSILDWSSVGDYIAVSSNSNSIGGYDLQVYKFDTKTETLSSSPFSGYVFSSLVSIHWSPDSRYIGLGKWNSDDFVTLWSYYKNLGLYRFDGTSYNIYQDNNTILKNGDNARGWVGFRGGITVPAGQGIKLNLEMPLYNGVDLRTTGSMILDNDLVLESSVSLSSGGIIGLNGQTLFLTNNLQIPADSILEFASSGIVDGQGYELVLGKYSQLMVDGGVAVTFKNMTIKNSLNTASCPQILCMDWYSKVCFDNVDFDFNTDWVFRNGQFFIYNDVQFTGTSKFSYRSVRPSYITSLANLIFCPNTTFEFYPSTTDNKLIQMQDKTSSIIFDGSTLQTTHTGIRLTKGNLYFDNKVTLSSSDNTLYVGLGQQIIKNYGTSVNSVAWSLNGKYLAAGGSGSDASTQIEIFTFNGSALTLAGSQEYGSGTVNSVSWHPYGKYLAIGGQISAGPHTNIEVYGFDGTTLSLTTTTRYGANVYSVSWSPNGKYLAVGGETTLANHSQLEVYYFNGSSLNKISGVTYGNPTKGLTPAAAVYDVAWSPDGKYIAIGGESGDTAIPQYTKVYSFNGASLSLITQAQYYWEGRSESAILGVRWSPDGKFLAIGGNFATGSGYFGEWGQCLQVYLFNGLTLYQVTTAYWRNASGNFVNSVDWSPDGNYIVAGGACNLVGAGQLRVYNFNGSSLNLLSQVIYGSNVNSVSWLPLDRDFAIGGASPGAGHDEIEVYPVNYTFDTTPQGFVNGISFGNSLLGAAQDLDVYLLGAARVGIYGKVWHDSLNSLNFVNRDSYISLNSYDSKFKITNDTSVQNWKEQQIIKSSAPNTLFLTDSQVWGASADNFSTEETFEFINNLIIPDNQIVKLSANAVIDGQGHDLILGKYSQILVDSGVTVTLKNMTIKNILNSINKPPVGCIDWFGQLCFDNVTFAFNNDWEIISGQFFVHNDVRFTGTSKFSYSAKRPIYIAPDSSLIFGSKTTFEYSPTFSDNSLIKMLDKTSSIFFNGSTLQTTHTGIRLTGGSLYFDNNVTLSSAGNTKIKVGPGTNVDDTGAITVAVAWSPNGKYLVLGNVNGVSRLYRFNGSSFTYLTDVDSGVYQVSSVAWSPDGNYLVLGRYNGNSRLYRFNGSSFTYLTDVDSAYLTLTIAWSPDGKYLVMGNYGDGNRLYRFNGNSFTYIDNSGLDGGAIYSVAWSPDGKYLVFGDGGGYPTQLYRFDGSTFTRLNDIGSAVTYSVAWSPDGKYLVTGNYNQQSSLYIFDGTSFSYLNYVDVNNYKTNSVAWSPDGKYLVLGNDEDQASKLYRFNGTSFTYVCDIASMYVSRASVGWSPDGKFLVLGDAREDQYPSKWFPIYYLYDSSLQSFSNGIIFGNSAIGESQDLDVYLLAAARVGIYGKVWHDSINSLNLQSRDSYISLDRYDSKLKITNAESVKNLKQQQIIKGLATNSLFLQDNQIWQTSGISMSPEETFELMNNLIIQDGQLVEFSKDTLIDGSGYNLILGKYSQLLIDGGITVTFKNMTIKNTINTVNIPQIRCMDWNSKACFDNVTFAFNDDWAFRSGQFFMQNDVVFTGTSKFSYRSVCPSYVASHANMIFGPNTIFEYYPSTTDNNLIRMQDKTSAIIFDGGTLQTTHTGIRLTKGSLYFDNNITLSSTDNTLSTTLLLVYSTSDSDQTWVMAWSPDGRYVVAGNANGYSNKLFRLDGTVLTLIQSFESSDQTLSVAWSPDGKYLVTGNNTGPIRLYAFDGAALELIQSLDSGYATTSLAWSPDGRYLVVGNSELTNRLYKFDGSILTWIYDLGDSDDTRSVAWHPNGRYLIFGNFSPSGSKLCSFDGSTITSVQTLSSSDNSAAVAWSPDGRYLTLGNTNQVSKLYRFNGTSVSLVYSTLSANTTTSLAWSVDGRYVVFCDYIGVNKIYRLDGETLSLFQVFGRTEPNYSVAWSPDGKYLVVGKYGQEKKLYQANFSFDTFPQGLSNGIIFGDSVVGANQDLDVYLLGGANVNIFGKVWYDCIN